MYNFLTRRKLDRKLLFSGFRFVIKASLFSWSVSGTHGVRWSGLDRGVMGK